MISFEVFKHKIDFRPLSERARGSQATRGLHSDGFQTPTLTLSGIRPQYGWAWVRLFLSCPGVCVIRQILGASGQSKTD